MWTDCMYVVDSLEIKLPYFTVICLWSNVINVPIRSVFLSWIVVRLLTTGYQYVTVDYSFIETRFAIVICKFGRYLD